ncbi:SMP-30/gluconolactonase/LRE family protein, partial [bacterium]|nr:SMP-30/gluconolactonase/LRE family protein [bacterium]
YNGKRLNSPNDVTFKSNGDMYFTDPPFGLLKSYDDPQRELEFCGVYRMTKDGNVTLLTKDLKAPNGIAFSPDEKTFYVSDSGRGLWMAFDVKLDGTITNGRTLFAATEDQKKNPGVADGMKVDVHGNIFGAAPGGLYVIASNGKHLGSFELGTATGNCAWGEDGSVLYIASNHIIYRIKLNTKGAGISAK